MDRPSTRAAWKVQKLTGFDGLAFDRISVPDSLGDHDCLVKIEASSLNYRDLTIPLGIYPFPMTVGVIPGSDAAGVVIATGIRVTRFQPGDRVCTTLLQGHLAGSPTPEAMQTGLGGSLDGTLCEFGVFEEYGLVHMPATLDFRQASTLPCAALTAWNALNGLSGRPLKAGDYVLTLGTGGVSIFALQFAVAAGATVISTTSSSAKATRLKDLGAKHVINYRDDPNWGETAKQLTPRGEGFDFVIEVGGPSTLKQSLASVKMDGILAVVGFVGGAEATQQHDVPSLLHAWLSTCVVRGIAVGSRAQFEEMNRAIDSTGLKPVVDEKAFSLQQVKDAYQYLWDQKHFGKVVIDCQSSGKV